MKYCYATLILFASAVLLFGQRGSSDPPLALSNMTNHSNETKQEEVRIVVRSNQWFNGTLMRPDSRLPVPAVVLIPGFVPGKRNQSEEEWRSPSTEDSGTTLARYLNELGIAVLRVPIGNFAAGGEPPASLNDLAERVLSGVRYLKERFEIDSGRVGVVGQSAGGFVAAAAAAKSRDITFMVTLATPMESIDRTFDEVLDGLLRSGDAPEDERMKIRKKMENIFASAAKGASAETLRPAVEDFLRAEYAWFPAPQRQMAGKNADEFVQRLLDDHVRDLTTPLYRTMIGYDVGQSITKIACPKLILFAQQDSKVEPKRGSNLATALLQNSGQTNWTVNIITGANHFFENAETGMESESRIPEQRFPPMFLDVLRNWLLKNTAPLPR